MKRFLVVVAALLLLAPFILMAHGTQQPASGTTGSSASSTQAATTPSKYHEAPMLAALVAQGKLPPVDQRLPQVPMVIKPNDQIGQYGGILVRGTNPLGEANLIFNRGATKDLPDEIQSYEFSKDGLTFTMHLREGLKWSNGDPVTADDFLFWYNDVYLNKTISPVTPSFARIGNTVIQMTKVDNYTVQLHFSKPFYAVVHQMDLIGNNNYFGAMPSKWLEKYHIKYNANADKIAKEAGFGSWWQYFRQVADLDDPTTNFTGEKLGRPELMAWVFQKETPTAYIYTRNPYYFKVDTAGNQLPYIDTQVQMKIKDQQVRLMKILSGQLDFAAWGTSLQDYPTIKENAAKSHYNAWVAKDLWGAIIGLSINQTYAGPNADVIGPMLRDIRFRQALSLAINREQINNLVCLDQGTPRQATVTPNTPGYNPAWATAYEQYDPAQANKLLDEMGMTKRDSKGMRLSPGGKEFSLDIPINANAGSSTQVMQLVQRDWQAVGIAVNIRTVASSSLSPILNASTYPVFAWPFDRVFGAAFIAANGSWLNPSFWFGPIGPFWANWLVTDGKQGQEPPQIIKELYNAAQTIQFVPPAEQVKAIQLIGNAYAKNLWILGTVGMAGKPVIANVDLGNVRRDAYPDNISTGGVRDNWLEQFYWKTAAKRAERQQ